MKITKVECIPVTVPLPMQGPKSFLNEVVIKIHTDEGFVGVADSGACYPKGVQDVIGVLIKIWEPFLIGANPLDIDLIATKLQRYLYNDMFQIPPAVTVIDYALWDLLEIGRAHV